MVATNIGGPPIAAILRQTPTNRWRTSSGRSRANRASVLLKSLLGEAMDSYARPARPLRSERSGRTRLVDVIGLSMLVAPDSYGCLSFIAAEIAASSSSPLKGFGKDCWAPSSNVLRSITPGDNRPPPDIVITGVSMPALRNDFRKSKPSTSGI